MLFSIEATIAAGTRAVNLFEARAGLPGIGLDVFARRGYQWSVCEMAAWHAPASGAPRKARRRWRTRSGTSRRRNTARGVAGKQCTASCFADRPLLADIGRATNHQLLYPGDRPSGNPQGQPRGRGRRAFVELLERCPVGVLANEVPYLMFEFGDAR